MQVQVEQRTPANMFAELAPLNAALIAQSFHLPLMLATSWFNLWAAMLSPLRPHPRQHHQDHEQLPVPAVMDHELFA